VVRKSWGPLPVRASSILARGTSRNSGRTATPQSGSIKRHPKFGGIQFSKFDDVRVDGPAKFDWRHSADDTLFAVERAALVYETSDLLYDHLGKKRSDVYQTPDNPKPALAKTCHKLDELPGLEIPSFFCLKKQLRLP